MKKRLTETQLRNIVYNTIKESIQNSNFDIYFIEDEADGGVYNTTSDKKEAIAVAKEMSLKGGHFIVKDRNDNVIFDTGGPSYKF